MEQVFVKFGGYDVDNHDDDNDDADADTDDEGNDDEYKEGGIDMDDEYIGSNKGSDCTRLVMPSFTASIHYPWSTCFFPALPSTWPPGYDDHDQMVNVMVVISMLVIVTKGECFQSRI